MDSSGSGYASVLSVFLTAGAVHVSVFGGFGGYFTHFRVKVDLGTSPRTRQPLVGCLCRVRCTGNSIYRELTSGIFRIAGMLRVPFGRRLAPVARQHGRYGPEGQYYRGYGSGICWAGFAGFAPRAVFLLSLSGPDALHHGRYGPD